MKTIWVEEIRDQKRASGHQWVRSTG